VVTKGVWRAVRAQLRFEWDPGKAARNIAKHQVSFEEAATVFDDPMFITVVAHTDREGRIRIISARKATKKEERFYAEAD
jgi:uncharacterized DUF497 family protein